MTKILIATHGKLASGLVNTVKMLIGDNQDIYHIDAYVDSSDFTLAAEQFLQDNQDTQIVVVTDIYGGSVNQRFTQFKTQYSFHLITGFNLPLVLEIALSDEPLTEQLLQNLIHQSRDELRLVSLIDTAQNTEEDFFTE